MELLKETYEDAILLDLAVEEQIIADRELYGLDIPEDEETPMPRRRWDGGTV